MSDVIKEKQYHAKHTLIGHICCILVQHPPTHICLVPISSYCSDSERETKDRQNGWITAHPVHTVYSYTSALRKLNLSDKEMRCHNDVIHLETFTLL